MKKITFLIMAAFSVIQINAQVSSYNFSQSQETYNEISTGTVLGVATGNAFGTPSLDDENYAVTLPFTFTFNGNSYTDCNVNSNGYITFGTTLPASNLYAPISGTTAFSGSISAFGGDINALYDLGGLTGDIIWEVTGTAPDREFVLQYRNFRPAYTTSTTLAPYINFQIILSETTNTIKFVYGSTGIAVGTTNSSTTKQIGLRGATNTDFKNRTNATTVLFTNSTAGTANTSSQAYSSLNAIPSVPTNGLTYIWSEPSCTSPTDIVSSSITASSATISWTAATSSPANGYEYYYSTTNTAPTNTTVLSGSVGAGITAVDLTGLQSNSTYYFWIRSVCSNSDSSEWTNATIFITLCNSFIPSFTENFTTFPPNCWSRSAAGDETTGPTGTGTGIWAADGFLNVGGTGAVKVNLYSFNRIGWLITPTIDMSAGNYRVKFDYGLTTWNATTTNTMGSDDYVQLLASEDGGVTWTGVTTFDASSNVSNLNNTFILDLTSFSSANTLFALYATDGTTDDASDYDFFVDNFVIETIPTCSEPTALTSSNITDSSATISWTEPNTPPANGYEYYYSNSNIAPTNTTVPSGSVGAGITTADLTSLQSSSIYYYWIRSVCSNSDSSVWTNSSSFTTSCTLVTDFFENFDTSTSLPQCWAKVGTLGTTNTQTAGALSLPNTLYIYSSSATNQAVVSMKPVSNAGDGTHRLRFKARANFTVGGNLEVGYLTDPADALTFTSLQTFTTTSTTSYDSFTAILGTAAGSNQVLAFRNSGVPANSILIEDVYWEPIPTCIEPTSLTSSNVTVSSATISWTASSTPPTNGYEYYYSTSNSAPTNSTVPSGSVGAGITTADLTLLNTATTYYFWVRSVCSISDSSEWSNAASFSTPCTTTSVPYTQDFETAVVPALPSCTSIENGGTGNNWAVVNNPGNGFTTKVLGYAYNTLNAANAWFFTNGISLTAGTQYYIAYKFGNNSTTYVEKMKVAVGTSPSVAAMTGNDLADHPTISGGVPTSNTINFTPSISGVYYFGFNAYSIANQFNLYLDDVSVTDILGTANFDDTNFSFYPNPVKNILNLSYNQDISNVEVFNLLGQKVSSNKINSNTAQVDMSNLSKGAYIVKVSSNDQIKTIKVIKE